MNSWFKYGFGALAVMVGVGVSVKAAERQFINGSFETPVVTNSSNWQLFNEAVVPGWQTTDILGNIELWRGLQGIVPPDGQQIAELNSTSRANMFQEVCLSNGETIQWSFAHRGRNGTERVRLEFGTQAITTVNTPQSFQTYSGTTVYTGPSGDQNITFVSLIPLSGSSGNLIDDIQITLDPLVEFLTDTNGGVEGNGDDIPRLRISGTVTASSTVDVVVTATSATQGSDYTHTATVVIPAGYYDGTAASSIPINLSILNNLDLESDETITFGLANPTGNVRFADADCAGGFVDSNVYTITDDDNEVDISVMKTDMNSNYVPGSSASYSIVITNNGPSNLAGATVQDTIPPGMSIDSSGAGVTCPAVAPNSCTIAISGNTINVTVDIVQGDSLTLQVPVIYSENPSDY